VFGVLTKHNFHRSLRVDHILTGTQETDQLINNLGNTDTQIRSNAVDALTTISKTEVINLLISLLQKDSIRIVKEGACKALGKIGDKRAIDVLIQNLNSPDESVRYQATIALGQIGDIKAVNPLIKIYQKRDDPLVRSEAAKALGMIGDPSALKILLSSLKKEKDRFIKYHTVTSLGKIGSTKAKRTLQKIVKDSTDDRLTLRAIEAIESIDKANNPKIVAG